MVVLYIGIMKVRGFWSQKQLNIYIMTVGTVLVWHSQTQKCLQINPKPFQQLIMKLKKIVYNGIFY